MYTPLALAPSFSRRFLPLAALSAALLACGGGPLRSTTGREGAEAPAPAPSATATVAAPVAPPPPAEAAYSIDGTSMSSIGQVELLAAFQKAGWASPTTASGSMFDAKYESISFPIGKGKLKGRVMLVRPTSSPAEKANPLVPPAELPAATNKETSAFVYDEPAAVFLSVEITAGGKAADAQKLVDVLVTKTR